MDPLSVAASVITLLTITSKIGSIITGLIKDTKTAPTELVEINKEVGSLALVLRRLQEFVDQEQHSNASATHGAYFGALDVKMALSTCRVTMQEIGLKVTYIESLMRGRPLDQIKYSFSWSSVKKDLRDLRMRLEYSKSSILMSLQLRTLEVMKAASQTSANTEASIRELLLEVQSLKPQQESQHDGGGMPWRPMQVRGATPAIDLTPPLAGSLDLPHTLSVHDIQDTSPSALGHLPQPTVMSEDTPAYICDYLEPSVSIYQGQRGPSPCYRRKSTTHTERNPVTQEIETHASIENWLSAFRMESPGKAFEPPSVFSQESPYVIFDC